MSSDKIWKFINREQVYDGDPYIKIFKDTVELPAGKIIDDYHRIEVNNAVMLLIENENKELYDYQRINSILKTSNEFSAEEIKKKLFNSLNKWLKGGIPQDDVTVLIIKKN